ncbi:MAG TPA: carbon storage regulator CsrA [Pirellulales bacterium]|nr:carbon storage regulator CsrA [Pirellulales bacterium]
MLVLNRKLGEKIYIGDDIVITVVTTGNDRVRLGFECPKTIPVHRAEIYERIHEEQRACTAG